MLLLRIHLQSISNRKAEITFMRYYRQFNQNSKYYNQYVEKITTILTNPCFLLKFSTTRFRHVSAYYQVMFNTDEQFLFLQFYNDIKRK